MNSSQAWGLLTFMIIFQDVKKDNKVIGNKKFTIQIRFCSNARVNTTKTEQYLIL